MSKQTSYFFLRIGLPTSPSGILRIKDEHEEKDPISIYKIPNITNRNGKNIKDIVNDMMGNYTKPELYSISESIKFPKESRSFISLGVARTTGAFINYESDIIPIFDFDYFKNYFVGFIMLGLPIDNIDEDDENEYKNIYIEIIENDSHFMYFKLYDGQAEYRTTISETLDLIFNNCKFNIKYIIFDESDANDVDNSVITGNYNDLKQYITDVVFELS